MGSASVENEGAPMLVGVDIGYSAVKIAYGSGKEPAILRLPVGAAPIARCGLRFDGTHALGGGHEVLINDERWVAGIEPHQLEDFVPTMDESYPSTDEYRALYYAALSAIGATKIDCLVTGLPVRQFRDETQRETLRSRLEGRHYIREDLVVEVERVMVIPQPAGAFGAHTLDGSKLDAYAKIRPNETVLVVDPGHYSLDWVVFAGGFKLNSSGSTSSAGEVVLKRAADLLSKEYGVVVRPARVQEAVLNGAQSLRLGDKEMFFWPAMTSAAEEIVNANLRALRGSVRSVSDARGVDLVLITGGGAAVFEKPLRDAFAPARVVMVHNSVAANARGFYVYAGQMLSKAAA